MENMDIKKLTLGEVAFFEDFTGQGIGAVGDEEKPKGKALSALIYLFKRRENPNYTMHDAENVTIAEASALLNDEAPEDSDEGKGAGSKN